MGSVRQEAIEIMAENYRRVPSPGTGPLPAGRQRRQPSAPRRPPPFFSHRNARYDLVVLSGWTDPADDDEATIRSAYRADTYRRLTELKARYDPTNFSSRTPTSNRRRASAQSLKTSTPTPS